MGTRAETLTKIVEIIDQHGFAPIACKSCGTMSETRDRATMDLFKKFADGMLYPGSGKGVRCASCGAGEDIAIAFDDTVNALR